VRNLLVHILSIADCGWRCN